jgi:glycolate oxidase iron-sulfur subunit
MMRSQLEGKMEMSGAFVDEMYFCLDCQACQTACPAGVKYGALVEDARRRIAEEGKEPARLGLTKKWLLGRILSSPAMIKRAASLLRIYRRSGLYDAVNASHILEAFSMRLHERHAMLPAVSAQWFDETVEGVLPATGPYRGTAAFLTGCVMNVMFAGLHRDIAEVLTRNGYDVVIPKNQPCCGSLHAHYGDTREAAAMARKFLDLFDQFSFDALVVDSAGCGAFLKEYGHLLAGDAEYAPRASALAAKTKDVTEFLAETGFARPESALPYTVTYHDACHLVHTQGISRQPRDIIRSIPGLRVVELKESTWCCGSAGIYNVVRFDDARKLLERKMDNLEATGAGIVLTANPGCHLQLENGIRMRGLKMKVMHPVSLLNEAYGALSA